jgi:hypothetical protein
MKKAILAITLGLACSMSHAEWQGDWFKVESDAQRTVLVHKNTSRNGDIVSVWTRFVKSDGTTLFGRNEFNCSTRMNRSVQGGEYTASGTIVKDSQWSTPSQWKYIVPDTTGDTVSRMVCQSDKK